MKALLIALALLALYAVPVTAQSGSVTIKLNCFNEPEGVTITNDTDEDIVFTGITSSFENDGDPERVYNLTIASGETSTAPIGDESASGSDNIFNNEEDESATVYVADDTFELGCNDGPRTFNVGGPPIEATEPPQPTVGPEETPEPTPTTEVPGKMPPTGAGGIAAGASVPWGTMGLAASGLLAAGYAVIRRR